MVSSFQNCCIPYQSSHKTDSKRNSASMLARQLRLRLVAEEGSDIPRNCSNIIVSIHAIATFQALNDYLRPRVSGLLGGIGGSRLSGMLAALAASGIPAGALARTGAGLVAGNPGESSTSQAHPPATGTSTGMSAPASAPAESSAAAGIARRRSLRLSARNAHSSIATPAAPAATNPLEAPTLDPPVSETVVNEDEDVRDDFPDDDFEAEVCAYNCPLTILIITFHQVFEDDVEPDPSVSETTVTLNVADGESQLIE